MSTVFNIRSTNGGGKSTAVRTLMGQFGFEPIMVPTTGKAIAYALKSVPDTYILGRYETACGGADTISSFTVLRGLIAHFAAKGHVIFEGSLFSTVFKGANTIAASLPEHQFLFGRLDTPVEVCIQRVLQRRAEAGNLDPFDPSGVIEKHKAVLASTERLAAAGWNVQVLPFEGAVAAIVRLLGLQPKCSAVEAAPMVIPELGVNECSTEETVAVTSLPSDVTETEQLTKLSARWKQIAKAYPGSPRWIPPSTRTWTRLLEQVPFVVLYTDVLGRLDQYSGSVRTDAITYLEMIVSNDGLKFTRSRGLQPPTGVIRDVDDDVDNVVPAFVSHLSRSA